MIECPDELITCFSSILKQGILNIRLHAEERDSQACFIEANHIHNIPELIRDFSFDLFEYYLTVETKQYKADLNSKVLSGIEKEWELLRRWYDIHKE